MLKNKLIIHFYKLVSFFCSQFFFLLPATTQIQSNYVLIPKGIYTIGKKEHLANPLRKVKTDSFYISTTEITNRQFAVFIEETQYQTDAEKYKNAMVFEPGLAEFRWLEDETAYWRYPNGTTRGGIENKWDHPVTTISYRDAIAYCNWAKVRLPVLDEWEIASRANAVTDFAWGTRNDSLIHYGNVWHGPNHLIADSSDGYMYTSPVASFKPNAYGLYDMYGNVFEFCSGKLEKYKNNKKIVHARGGSWWCSKNSCNFFNSADIGRVARIASFSNQGFRVVKK